MSCGWIPTSSAVLPSCTSDDDDALLGRQAQMLGDLRRDLLDDHAEGLTVLPLPPIPPVPSFRLR